MRLKIMTLAAVALGVITGATIALAAWAVQEWAAPAQPAIYMGVGLVLLYIPLVYWGFRTTQQELKRGLGGGGESAEERGLKRLVGLILQVMVGLLGLFIVSLWNFDVVRAGVIADAPNRDTFRIGRALMDSSPRVREAACKAAFEDGASDAMMTLVAALDTQPRAATRCLEFAQERGSYGHQLLAKRLLGGWERQLLGESEAAADATCQLVPFIAPVSLIAEEDNSDLMLLQCAMASNAGSVRSCCAEELKRRGRVLDEFGVPETIPGATAIRMLPNLVTQAFRPLELEASDQTLGKGLKMEEEESRRWVLQLSCHLFGKKHDRDVIRALVPLIESNTCGLSQKGRVVYVDPKSWGPICEAVLEAPGVDIEKTLCRSLTDGLLEIAVEKAKLSVKTSTSSMRLADTSREIYRGTAGAAAAKKREDPYNPENWKLYKFEGKPRRLSGAGSLCVKRSMGEGYGRGSWTHKEGPPVKEIATLDCEPQFDLDTTLASWKRENAKRMKELMKKGPALGSGDQSEMEKKYGKAAVGAARRKMQNHWKKYGRQ